MSQKLRYTYILDKSGSMGSIRQTTIEGINAQIASAKENGARDGIEITASVVLFDSGANTDLEYLAWNVSAEELRPVTWEQFEPRGSTPLNDAIGIVTERIQKELDNEGVKNLVSIFTDGGENSSKRFKRDQIMTMIQELEKGEQWAFSFVGAGGIDEVTQVARGYGISANMVAAYDGSLEQAKSTFGLMAASLSGTTTRLMRGDGLATTGAVNFYHAPENFIPNTTGIGE